MTVMRTHLMFGSLLWLLLLFTTMLYWPGLGGGFIYDDFPNLQGLQTIHADSWMEDTRRYLDSNDAGPLGRPIAFLSFAAQYADWPDRAGAFRYINLLLHLLCGCLIFVLLLQLGSALRWHEQQCFWIATLVTALWLLNPLHVSTVLYTVQRMAQLATLFMLMGMVGYLWGRQRLVQQGGGWSGFIACTASLCIGGLLAAFSKENGVLLVLYIAVLEITLLPSLSSVPGWRLWRGLFIWLPVILLFSYLAWSMDSFIEGYASRDYTFTERMLSEPRILFHYLGKLLGVIPDNYGVFQDGFPLSTDLFTPISTLLSLLALFGLLILALWQHRRFSIFAFAVLWFLAGHILESSVIGLLPYFEHRNYLPSLGPLLAIGYVLLLLWQQFTRRSIRIGLSLLLLLWMSWLVALTVAETRLWGQADEQAITWAERNPESLLSQVHALSRNFQQTGRALRYLRRMARLRPDDTQVIAMWLHTACYNSHVPLPEHELLLGRLREGTVILNTLENLRETVDRYIVHGCPILQAPLLSDVLLALSDNPNSHPFAATLFYLRARLAAHRGSLAQAAELAADSLQYNFNPRVYKSRIIWLAESDQRPAALVAIAEYRARLNPVLDALHLGDLDYMEQVIQQQMAEHK